MKLKTTCALLAAVGLAAMAAAPASATVIVNNFSGGSGTGDTFDPADPIGTLPAVFLNESASNCGGVAGGCTYDFVFQLSGLSAGDLTTLEAGAQAQVNHHATAEPISFDLFSGSPGGTPSVANNTNPNWLGHSDNSVNGTPTSPVFDGDLPNGLYYLQITGAQVQVSGEASSGSITLTLVPEPAAWGLMLLGFGGVGAALRRRQAKSAAVAA